MSKRRVKGEKNMFCSQCGAEMVNGACPNCTAENTQTAEQAYEPDYVEVKTQKKKKAFALAIICMVTGIASIVLQWGIVGGIAALVTGSIYKKKNEESHAMVVVGKIFGVLGIIAWVVALAIAVIWMLVVYSAYFAFLFAILSNY